MRSLSPSEFLGQYPDFASLDIEQVSAALKQAESYCPADLWREKQSQAIALVAAHSLAMRWLQIGAIASSSVQNAKGKSDSGRFGADSWLQGTTWGQEFLQLRKSIIVTGFFL
jgi:hypothetical protein